MVKRKKKSTRLSTHGFGVKNLAAELRRAAAAAAKKDWGAVWRVLEPLSQQYPQEKRVWEDLVDASIELGDRQLCQKACEGLFAAAPTGTNAYALAGAYLRNKHPLMALQTFHKALEIAPDHPMALRARETVEELEPIMENALAEMGLTGSDDLNLALLHERGQVYMEQGDTSAAREAEEKVLEQRPDFVSARNNLSLISWVEGDIEAAIAAAQAVLAQEPDNVHALSNLIRFLAISGDTDAARPYGDRLKASQAQAWDSWTKKVEGLTYLADDAGVVAVWEQAQAVEAVESPTSAFFYHLSAVALARTGDEKQAIRQWKRALEKEPGFSLAEENLQDIRKPVGRRHGAWPFGWEEWLSAPSSKALLQTVRASLKSAQSGGLTADLKAFFKRYPDVMAMLPRILERGGPQGQEFILKTTEQLKTPALLDCVKDFALGQNGSDQQRNLAANLAAQAKLIPKTNVRLWMEGEWRELMLLAYEFHGDPIAHHSKQVERLLWQALQRLRAEQGKEAEALLTKALELEPDAPDLMNNLAMALGQQGLDSEAGDLIRDIASRHPDYIFARATVAKMHLLEGDIEAAEALLLPFLERDRFNFMEFSAFSDTYIRLLIAQKNPDSARNWLNLWEQVDPGDSRLDYWENRLSLKLSP